MVSGIDETSQDRKVKNGSFSGAAELTLFLVQPQISKTN
jgi:hypothetical protein